MKWMTKETKKIEEAHKFLKNEEFDVNDLGDEFFDELHSKIMMKVEETDIQTPTKMETSLRRIKKACRLRMKPFGAITLGLGMIMFVAFQFYNIQLEIQSIELANKPEEVVLTALNNPSEITQTLLTHQTESDFFVDVANRSFDDVNIEKMNRLLGAPTKIKKN